MMQHQKHVSEAILKMVDKLTGEIECKFHSSTSTFYTKVEVVLEKAVIGEEVPADLFSEIIDHFQDDLEETELQTKLRMLKNPMHATNILLML